MFRFVIYERINIIKNYYYVYLLWYFFWINCFIVIVNDGINGFFFEYLSIYYLLCVFFVDWIYLSVIFFIFGLGYIGMIEVKIVIVCNIDICFIENVEINNFFWFYLKLVFW